MWNRSSFQNEAKSGERFGAGEIADSLNSVNQPKFKVSKRSVRDRLTLLLTRHKQNIRMEERAPGIDCEETEVDVALAEIIEKEKVADLERKKMQVLLQRRMTVTEPLQGVRLKAMESLGQTQQSNADSDGREITPHKSRRKTSEAMEYLEEK